MQICYHGTNRDNARAILKEGFRTATWFARNLQDAIGFGGLHVFEVCFDDPPDAWQFLSDPVPVDRIVSYKVYTVSEEFENKELRKKIFDSNTKN